jgi:hypothetical protein
LSDREHKAAAAIGRLRDLNKRRYPPDMKRKFPFGIMSTDVNFHGKHEATTTSASAVKPL